MKALLLLFGLSAFGAEVHQINPDLRVEQIAPGVWWHVSYSQTESFGRVGGNGLVVVAGDRVVLIDTPWDDAQTGRLSDWLKQRFGTGVTDVIATHSHNDCMGGLAEAHRRGAVSYSTELTAKLAREAGDPVPQKLFSGKRVLKLGGTMFELWHPGGGHTRDNIVVWLPGQKVLYGGCLVKRTGAGMGFTGDADLAAWPETIRRVLEAYPDVEVVVPGHGRPGGREYLTFTAELVSGVQR